jgi:hypothetical protein
MLTQWSPHEQSRLRELGRPSSYDPSFCELVVELGAQGMSKAQMVAVIGVSRKTMTAWAERHQEFADAVEWALDLSLAWWETVGQTNLTRPGFNATAYAFIMKQRFRADYGDLAANEPTDRSSVAVDPAEAPRDTGPDHLAALAKRYSGGLRVIEGGWVANGRRDDRC